MDNDVLIAASAMCFDWKKLGEQLDELLVNDIDYLHFDLIDGVFAPDFGMGTSIINSIRENVTIPAEYHLMVENPSRIFETLTIQRDDIVTIHQEACKNLHRDLITLKKLGAKVGVALNPGTHINTLDYILEDLDHILIMTVNPGFKGQKLVEKSIEKISDARTQIEKYGLKLSLGVDGNVNESTIPRMVSNGANYLVGGSSGLFLKERPISKAIKDLREIINYAK